MAIDLHSLLVHEHVIVNLSLLTLGFILSHRWISELGFLENNINKKLYTVLEHMVERLGLSVCSLWFG